MTTDNDTSNTTANATDDTSEPKEPFTKEQFSALNSAISSYTKKLEKSFETKVSEAVSKLSPKAPKPEKTDREIELEAQLAEKEVQFAKTQQEFKERDRDVSLKQHLLTNSVLPDAVEHVLAVLTHTKALSFDDEGNPVMTVNGKTKSLSDGVKEWLKLPQAKFYISPKGVSGSGSDNSNSSTSAKKISKPNLGTFNNALLADLAKK